MTDHELTHAIIGAAIEVHRALGPGLLEAVYEECLAKELTLREIPFERQKPVPLVYKDLKLECGYRLDFSWPDESLSKSNRWKPWLPSMSQSC